MCGASNEDDEGIDHALYQRQRLEPDGDASAQAARTRAFLVRLSGRQMKCTRPVTFPVLLDSLFKLLTMLETLEHYSLAELKEFAHIAKSQFDL